ncbi:unnamed protein product [Lymnaea stagnalis]|uniref:Peptidase S1 domain-containing protein n=1 Tax=Lymnaea stagnalis TaxID=6523 RepID=A0AAV2H3W3_LYMST
MKGLFCTVFVLLLTQPLNSCKRYYERRCGFYVLPRLPLSIYHDSYMSLRYPTVAPVVTPLPHGLPAELQEAPKDCGTMGVNMDSSIIHGNNAPENSWPWQAFVQGETKVCSGVLIAESWILTVAHCINNTRAITLGRIHVDRWEANTIQRSAAMEILHKHYDQRSKGGDIALIKLSSPVEFNNNVRPICLPTKSEIPKIPVTCVVTGWGLTNPKLELIHNHLQQLKVNILPQRRCRFLWSLKGLTIHNGHVCLDFNATSPHAGVCKGDSGGPLSCQVNGRYYLYGLGSFVEGGCQKELIPDVFTRVTEYMDWIHETIRVNS